MRTTQDSDIITKMEKRHIRSFVNALEKYFFIDDLMIEKAVAHKSSFNIIHKETMFKIDIFTRRKVIS